MLPQSGQIVPIFTVDWGEGGGGRASGVGIFDDFYTCAVGDFGRKGSFFFLRGGVLVWVRGFGVCVGVLSVDRG